MDSGADCGVTMLLIYGFILYLFIYFFMGATLHVPERACCINEI